LREIAAGKVTYANPDYLQGIKVDYKPILDDTEFVDDEEYLE
jgi:DNA-directed RNA polymerase subunit omega